MEVSHGMQDEEGTTQSDQEEHQEPQQEDSKEQVLGGTSERDAADYEKAISERDARIAELEKQVGDAAKSAEVAKSLTAQIEELKAQSAAERTDFALTLAGCRNVKAARALLDEHDGKVDELKAAEPWLFQDALAPAGTTGLAPAGVTNSEDNTMRRWRRIAGLADES